MVFLSKPATLSVRAKRMAEEDANEEAFELMAGVAAGFESVM